MSPIHPSSRNPAADRGAQQLALMSPGQDLLLLQVESGSRSG